MRERERLKTKERKEGFLLSTVLSLLLLLKPRRDSASEREREGKPKGKVQLVTQVSTNLSNY